MPSSSRSSSAIARIPRDNACHSLKGLRCSFSSIFLCRTRLRKHQAASTSIATMPPTYPTPPRPARVVGYAADATRKKPIGVRKKKKKSAGKEPSIDTTHLAAEPKNKGEPVLNRQNQHLQGLDVNKLDEILGEQNKENTIVLPPLACNSPIQGIMSLTIHSGLKGNLRLRPVKEFQNPETETIVVPASSIGQAFILVAHHIAKDVYHVEYEVIIVPGAAAGVSSIKGDYHEIISFYLPAKEMAADNLRVSGTELGPKVSKTFLSAVKATLNEQLLAFNKSVLDLASAPKPVGYYEISDGPTLVAPCTLFNTARTPMTPNVRIRGWLVFLDTSLLFTGFSTKCYIPLSDIREIRRILHYFVHRIDGSDAEPRMTSRFFRLSCTVLEPPRDPERPVPEHADKARDVSTKIEFGLLPVRFAGKVIAYFNSHNIKSEPDEHDVLIA